MSPEDVAAAQLEALKWAALAYVDATERKGVSVHPRDDELHPLMAAARLRLAAKAWAQAERVALLTRGKVSA